MGGISLWHWIILLGLLGCFALLVVLIVALVRGRRGPDA